jgi:uncharacterized SAM-binding protein YcdF (DUF218 family)
MFFALSKTLSLVALPSNLLILFGLAGVALTFTRWVRVGRRMLAGSLIVFAVIGVLPVGDWALGLLENRFPKWSASGNVDGIIVLGGAIDPDLSAERGEAVIGGSVQRLTVVPKLAREYPQARIVYSGGSGLLFGGASEADVAGPLLVEMGVPARRIELERASRNTFENAQLTKAMVAPKPGERWLLVTSAAHMPRAIGCFRRVDFPVEAYPVDWRGGSGVSFRLPVVSGGLSRLDNAVREWLGLAAYRLTDRTSDLFPGP